MRNLVPFTWASRFFLVAAIVLVGWALYLFLPTLWSSQPEAGEALLVHDTERDVGPHPLNEPFEVLVRISNRSDRPHQVLGVEMS
jgi:hypothetical protein